jgi:hypothetical protein
MFAQWIEGWSTVYSAHSSLRSAVEFVHLGGLLAGGGCAVAADLATISSARENNTARATELQLLKRTHGLVVAGLVALVVSGLLLLAADLPTYLYSMVFWIKMVLVGLLLANGFLLLHGERKVRNGNPAAWMHLHYTAVVSLVLWFLTTLAGAILPNLG